MDNSANLLKLKHFLCHPIDKKVIYFVMYVLASGHHLTVSDVCKIEQKKSALPKSNAHFFVLIYRHLKQSNGFCQNNEINAIN